ncbi:MAG TPA: 4Fe-4S dicluster domain-containing protein, partial [Acidobacteria bacterium]|nr:4Fe-4S dicluster domain-containing protein [Acidobacteriota bacterium]
ESRRRNLQLLALNHRMECPVCERSGDCRFQELIYLYGTPEQQLPFELVRRPRDVKSPVIVRDPEKCILCGKCVRLCDEVQGVGEIGLVGRGLDATVMTLLERPLDCEFCGQCVNACPVGALIARPYVSEVPAWLREHRTTVCSWCSCGCELEAELYEGRVLKVTSRTGSEPNDGVLCVKGWLGWDVLHDPERLTHPLVRRHGRLEPASWEDALEAVAAAATRARRGGLQLAAAATPRLTSEDAILLRHLMEDGFGSQWTSLGPEAGIRALTEGMGTVWGVPASTANLDDVRAADLVLVLRGDPGRTHPLMKNELVRRHRQRGRPFALAAAFTGGAERHARPFLRLRPGAEAALLGYLGRELDGLGRLDRSVAGFDSWRASVEPCTEEWAVTATGVPVETLRELVGAMAAARTVTLVVVTGRGLPGEEAEATRGAACLAAALGDGAGVVVLGEKSNLAGCIQAGLERRPGRELLEASKAGRIGWLYLVGQDPAGAWPRSMPGREALEGAGFVVVQDAFLTETARAADVVLPAAILIERDGTGIGSDGGVRRYRRIVDPPAGARQDGEIIRALADHLGIELPSPDTITEEVAHLAAIPGPPRLVPVETGVPGQPGDGFLVDPSPSLFHSGSTTTHSALLRELSPGIAVRIAPADAEREGLGNGDAVRLVADGREVLLRARIDRRVTPGSLGVLWRSRDDSASRLIDDIDEVVSVHLRRS